VTSIIWVIALVGGGLLIVILSLVILLTVSVRRLVGTKIQEAEHWPSTQGVVLTSEVRDAGGDSGWYANVVYRYEVGGCVYENSRIAVAVEPGSQSFQAHQQLAARYPVGAQVMVYYNPQNPADAALMIGDPNSWSPSDL
jgi:hypothetical protein